MNTVAFLRHILAVDQGWICIDIKTDRGFSHRFFHDAEDAATYIHEQDARGLTVYHACAVFKEPTTRKQVNAAYLKSFWGDVDVGPDKGYETREEAHAALNDFLAATGLPPPTVVYSGPYGMHLYWVLEEPIAPEIWRPCAEALRGLCKAHGFKLDHSRTADQSSVLRPPGTHNKKYGSDYSVTVAQMSPPVWVGDLPFGFNTLVPRAQSLSLDQPRLLEGAAVHDNRPSDAHKIIAECAQIRDFYEKKGDIPYSPWLYSIWTLHFTLQGDALAHEWSSGHPKYSPEETQRKLDAATSPIRCTTFALQNKLCEGCKYQGKISTPLELGRSTVPQQILQEQSVSIYSCSEQGLWVCSEKADRTGKLVSNNTMISRWPIELVSVCQSEHGQDFSLNFSMSTPHMNGHSITIGSGMFFSSQGMAEMHRLGAVIHHADYMRDYVRKEMDKYNTENIPQTRYTQFGWKDLYNSFLFGNQLYTQSQVIKVVGAPEVERRARMLGPRTGSLTVWSAAANKLFALGCEPHSFALMCSFGALLMRFLSEEEGGTIINLVSEGSATGKTTGLEAVASVWGELGGLRLLDEDTQISRGIFLGTLGNLPCVFDELHKRDPDSIRVFVTIFTSGRDKLRARADGTLQTPAGDWQTILVVGSNISLTDILQSKNSEEPQAFRVIELICDQQFTGHEGDKLRRILKENRGWAGDAFVRYLMQPGVLQVIRERLDCEVRELWNKHKFDIRHRFWVRGLACALVAGDVVNHLGILDFSAKRIVDWVVARCMERKEVEVTRDYAQTLNLALYDVWPSTLVVNIEWKPNTACLVLNSPSQNRGFLARRVRESGRMYVQRAWLRKWLVDHGINRTGFTTDLKKRRIILNDSKFVTLGAGTDLNTGGQIICFEIDMHHPDMAGSLLEMEHDVPPGERERKPISSLLAPGVASPSPHSTLQ